MAFSARSTRFRLFVLLGSVGIFLLAFPSLHSLSGRPLALVPLSFPVLAMAWFYGLRGGLIASLVSIPVSIIMVNLVDDTLTRGTILFHSTMVTPTLFRVAAACFLGGLRDVYQKVKKSEAALEAANAGLETRVAIRTEELSRQQEILSEGQSLAKFGTIERDFQTGGGWWSNEVYNLLGIAPQKRTPTMEVFLEHVHPQDREYIKEMIAKTRKTGNADAEYRIIRSSGEELTVDSRARMDHDEAGNPVQVIVTLLDITERKQAEMKIQERTQQLAESEERFRTMIDTAPDGIFLLRQDGTIALVNKFAEERFGYDRSEMVGQPLKKFLPEGRHGPLEEEIKDFFSRPRRVCFDSSMDLRILAKDGRECPVEVAASPLKTQEGVVACVIFRDITKRKEAQEKLEKTQKELSNLSKHLIQAQEEERRRIALELHDQLGQELALLSIEIERLIQKAPESQAKQLQKLTLKTREVSSQVQTLSHQLHPSSLEHLGLAAASRSLCKEVSRSSGIQIDFSHMSVPSPIPQDVSICLYRVLQESLTNIVKHSGTREAQVKLTGHSDEIHLYVCDSGVGFDPESAGNGGLGFVSMRERLNLVGGELLIESQPSVGTQIKACVPLNSSASPIEHPTEVQEG